MIAAITPDTDDAPDPVKHGRLVWKVAMMFTGQGLDIEDLASEGQFGLMEACERFDPSLGNKFSTFAVPKIRSAIRRAIRDKGRLIRLPAYLQFDRKTASPSDACLIAARRVFDAQILRDGDGERCPRLADLVADTAEDDHEPDEDPRDVVTGLFRWLTPRQSEVLRLRFGLDGEDAMTLEQIGKRFGVTKEYIRQIEAKAMERLRICLAAKERSETA